MVNGIKIKKLREQAGANMAEFAEMIHVSQSMLSYVESGFKQPSVETLKRIADRLGCTMDDLVHKETLR